MHTFRKGAVPKNIPRNLMKIAQTEQAQPQHFRPRRGAWPYDCERFTSRRTLLNYDWLRPPAKPEWILIKS